MVLVTWDTPVRLYGCGGSLANSSFRLRDRCVPVAAGHRPAHVPDGGL